MRPSVILATVLFLSVASARCDAGVPQPVFLRNATVFDSAAGKMLPHRTVAIVGRYIQAVGTPEQPVEIPNGAQVIDCAGKYVIPGLIDAHVHLFLHPGAEDLQTVQESVPEHLRERLSGWLHTGTPIGFLLRSLLGRFHLLRRQRLLASSHGAASTTKDAPRSGRHVCGPVEVTGGDV